ncbi:chaperonin 10-like protein [Aspergillus unguis]
MKEAIVSKGPAVEVVDSPVPTPKADEVLIKVVVSGTNPKDWKLPEWLDQPGNQGDDIAGTVEAVGDNVTEFKKGDRVMAFHQMMAPGGSYAEYAIAWQHTTAHLPKKVSFEEAATIPLAALTSVAALYHHLALPAPWSPATASTPLVVYGGASATGAFAIQLARKSNIHPIITVAGRGAPFVEGLIDRSKGDTIIDYRKGDDAVVSGIQDALKGAKLYHAYDCVSEGSSFANLGKAVAPGGKIVTVLPFENTPGLPDHVEYIRDYVGCVHEGQKDLGYVYFRYMAKGLQDGWFKPHPHEVVPGGLNGLQTALANLKQGKVSATKYVARIEDTA